MVGHAGPIVSVEASADAIVTSSFDGTVRVWSWEGRQRAVLAAHDGHSSGLALSGDKAYSGGDDGLCKRWDLATEACVDVMHGHEGAVWCVA
jgi:WD40 repeat protein